MRLRCGNCNRTLFFCLGSFFFRIDDDDDDDNFFLSAVVWRIGFPPFVLLEEPR